MCRCSNGSVFLICIAVVHCRSVHLIFFPYSWCRFTRTLRQGDTIGQKLSRLSLSVISNRKSSINPPDRDDCLLATHPSDHNAVYIDTISHKGREKRLSKTQKRKTRDLEKLKHGKLDEKTYHRGLDHNAAFLMPVPMYYGYGVPGAAYAGAGGFGAGCATVSGFLISLFVFPLSHRSF